MGIRKEQREKRRWEILEAALDLFISKGYAETKIGDIAERVGMSMGLLFHYFESKAKLYEELIRIGVSGPVSMMALDTTTPLLFFETVAGNILTAIQDNPFTAKMFALMYQVQLNPSLSEPIQALLREASVLDKTVSIIEAGQACGQIRPGNPEALSALYWQALSGVALYAALVPGAPIPEPEWIVDCIRSPKARHPE